MSAKAAMSGWCARIVLAAGLAFCSPFANASAADESRLLFAGDVLLAREVAHEITAKGGTSPWSEMNGLGHADFAMANFEGAVGDSADCPKDGAPCFAVREDTLHFLAKAGFTAVGLANNHAGDLGAAARQRSKSALRNAGIAPLTFEDSPGFVRIGQRLVAVITINLARGRDGSIDAVPSLEVERKLRLARAFADWVVVSVHWGAELKDWPQPAQKTLAAWFVDQGADLVVGHHPHVVIAPECVHGRPVFYSLGNHVFDQKYPETKRGMLADCRIRDGALTCSPVATITPPATSFPRFAETPARALSGKVDAGFPKESATKQRIRAPFRFNRNGIGSSGSLAGCSAPARAGLTVSQWRLRPWGEPGHLVTGAMVIEGQKIAEPAIPPAHWKVAGRHVLSAEIGRLAADHPPYLLTIERHRSPIDREDGPRPYVYDVSDHGLIARWRGSALAWPLIDARLMETTDGTAFLCALHRADSFIRLNPSSTGTRIAIYRWSGFGFSAVTDATATAQCQEMYRTWRGAKTQ